jgi:hypothetical protein
MPGTSSTVGLRILLGATVRFLRCLFFCGRTHKDRGGGGLLGTHLPGRLLGRTTFGLDPLCGDPAQLGLLCRTQGGNVAECGSRALLAPGVGQCTLFDLDLRIKGGSSLTLRLHLLGVAGFGFGSGCFRFGQCTCGFGRTGLVFGLPSGDGGTPRFGFQFGTALRLPDRILLFRCPRQRRGGGGLLGLQLLGRTVGSESFGLGPLGRRAAQFRFPLRACSGSGRKLGGGSCGGLRRDQRRLFRSDAFAQRRFRAAFSAGTLGERGLCRGFLLGTPAYFLRRTLFFRRPRCGRVSRGLFAPHSLGGAVGGK